MNGALWLKDVIGELGIVQDWMSIHCDNQSVIHLVDHQMYHERTKYIDVILHFVREIVEVGEVRIKKIASEKNLTYVFGKSL